MKIRDARKLFGGILGTFFLALSLLSALVVSAGWAADGRPSTDNFYLLFVGGCGLISLGTGLLFLRGGRLSEKLGLVSNQP